MAKVSNDKLSELDFLINCGFEIVEYKRGRGIYGDRVILKRSQNPSAVFGDSEKLCDFYYMDTNAVKELPFVLKKRIDMIIKFLVSPELMNQLCGFDTRGQDPQEWAIETNRLFKKANSCDFELLNKILLNQYRELNHDFLKKLKKHRERQYYLASCVDLDLIDKDYANDQVNDL